MTPQEMSDVALAFKAGKRIQFRRKDNPHGNWLFTDIPRWNFEHSNYRVEPPVSLKACPCCGSSAYRLEGISRIQICCVKCGLKTALLDESAAIKAWNLRVLADLESQV